MLVCSFILLGQSEQDLGRLFIWALVLMGICVAAFVIISFFRKRILDHGDEGASGFSLSNLRELHRTGQLSDEEFEKSKAALVTAMKAAAEKAALRRAEAKDNPDRRGTKL